MGNNIENMSFDKLLDNFRSVIKENKLKYTTQREAILKTLYENPHHFTSENLYLLVKKSYPNLNIGIATIYRTLSLLEKNGLVSSISLGVHGKKFEIANKPHHDHIICTECGKIVEFENKEIESIQQNVAKVNHFELSDHLMQLYGICEDCQ